MKKTGFLLLVLLLLMACSKNPDQVIDFTDPVQNSSPSKDEQNKVEEKLIYGSDNRLENYQATDALRSLASSTLALVKSTSLTKTSAGSFTLSGDNFGSAYNLCSNEPFREQTSGAFCSGSLLAPDIVVTAGHCITNANDCAGVRFVFDFALTSATGENRTFTQNQVYSCKEIIHREQANAGADFAVIRLDRSVVGRAPLAFKRGAALGTGEPLFVIGHPAGLPQKIAGGAVVRSVQSSFYTTNLDTYGGNSGSAVFNGRTNEVEGVLVRGDTDFVSQGSCNVSNRCAETGCRGEDVTRMDQVTPYLPAVNPPTPTPGPTPAPVQEQTFASATKVAIPDAPKAGIESSIVANAAPAGRKVYIKVDITHTYRGDLLVEILAPGAKTAVTLHKRTGGSLDNLKGTYGVDLPSAQALNSLSAAPAGTWKLRITDQAAQDVGSLNSWALTFK